MVVLGGLGFVVIDSVKKLNIRIIYVVNKLDIRIFFKTGPGPAGFFVVTGVIATVC